MLKAKSSAADVRTMDYGTTLETVDEDGEHIKRKETVYESVYNPPVDHFTQCETRFVIAPDGYVETFSFQGDACVAVEES